MNIAFVTVVPFAVFLALISEDDVELGAVVLLAIALVYGVYRLTRRVEHGGFGRTGRSLRGGGGG